MSDIPMQRNRPLSLPKINGSSENKFRSTVGNKWSNEIQSLVNTPKQRKYHFRDTLQGFSCTQQNSNGNKNMTGKQKAFTGSLTRNRLSHSVAVFESFGKQVSGTPIIGKDYLGNHSMSTQLQDMQRNAHAYSRTAVEAFEVGNSGTLKGNFLNEGREMSLDSKKPNLKLETFQEKKTQQHDAIYDESPAKMVLLREQQKSMMNQTAKEGKFFALTSTRGKEEEDMALRRINESIKEDMNSCERSPPVERLLSPMSSSPKRVDSNGKTNTFSFTDTKLFGDECLRDNPLLKFNANYKNVEKIVEMNSHYQNENSLDVAMLRETIGRNVLPRKLGIVKQQLPEFVFPNPNAKHKLDLSNQNISRRYHEMISSALSHNEMANLYSLNLSSNNLFGESLKIIARNIPASIQKIDLKENNLGSSVAIGVLPLLDTRRFTCLRVLNLVNNNITDTGLTQLQPGFLINRSLQRLDLSHNKLTDSSGEIISKFLTNSSYLRELYLHWNKISSYGGLAIAQGLSDNHTLQVLDLSHNGLGMLKKLKCGVAIIKNCSIKGTSMKHLDLSFNMFQVEEGKDIAKLLQDENRNLFGIHFEGNLGQGFFDPRGFLQFPNQINSDASSHIGMIEKARINGVKYLGMNKQDRVKKSPII